MPILSCIVKPEVKKGAQWRKVASRGDGTTTAELMCQAEGIPLVDFSWEKNGLRMDFANPRSDSRHYSHDTFHLFTIIASALLSALGDTLINAHN